MVLCGTVQDNNECFVNCHIVNKLLFLLSLGFV